MKGIHVFLVGSGLFAENVATMIRECGAVGRVDCFPSLEMTTQHIEKQPPDILIIADVDSTFLVGNIPTMPIWEDIPVIFTDHQSNILKLITSINLPARLPDLLDALTILKNSKVQR